MAAVHARLEKVKGIVLKRTPLGETDQIVSLYTLELGKIRVVAGGSLRIKSKWQGKFEPFYRIDAEVFHTEKSTLYRFSHADVTGRPTGFLGDLTALHAAYVALECLDKFCEQNSPNIDLYQESLSVLANINKTPEFAGYYSRCYCFRFLALSGYGINLNRCSCCNRERLPNRSAYCLPSVGGIVCSNCLTDLQKRPESLVPSGILNLAFLASQGQHKDPVILEKARLHSFNMVSVRMIREMFSFHLDAIPSTLKLIECVT